MKNIKSTIRDHIVQPGMRETKRQKTLARVIATNERRNTCSIKYKGRNGDHIHQDEVYVKIDQDGCGWFPKRKDIVVVEEENGRLLIIEPFEPNYGTNTRIRRRLKEDLYADKSSDDLAGNIF